jgi:hypothetical protein
MILQVKQKIRDALAGAGLEVIETPGGAMVKDPQRGTRVEVAVQPLPDAGPRLPDAEVVRHLCN